MKKIAVVHFLRLLFSMSVVGFGLVSHSAALPEASEVGPVKIRPFSVKMGQFRGLTDMGILGIPDDDQVLIRHGRSSGGVLEVGQKIRLLVWNIYKAKRRGLLSDLLDLSEQADLVLLQESILNGRIVTFYNIRSSFRWDTVVSWFDGDGVGTGVANGSRFAVDQVGFIRSQPREPVTNTPKMIAITDHPIEGRDEKLRVINIHAINFVRLKTYKRHIDQLIVAVATHSGPLIVAGDFNTWDARRFRYAKDRLREQGVELVRFAREPRRIRLDWIFTRGLKAMGAKVLADYGTSDHYPLYAELVLE